MPLYSGWKTKPESETEYFSYLDAVFESVLMMTGRNRAVVLLKAQALRTPLKALLDHLDQALKEEPEEPI